MNMTPVICSMTNIVAPVASHNVKYIEKPFKPGRKTMNEWLKYVVENQFTIDEIANGTAYETLQSQKNA